MTDGPDLPVADRRYDAGDTLCGELALALRTELRGMPPGAVLEVVASDAAAPQDLPAWCELTGHTLVRAEPPRFWIRRKPD